MEGWGWSYIFRWHNFLELVQSKLLLALAHVLPEDLLQPGDVLLVEYSSLQRVGYHNNKGHELLNGGVVVAVLVNAAHQLRDDTPTRPDLREMLCLACVGLETVCYFVEGVRNHVIVLTDKISHSF